jgi:uncharacterized protein with NRDE domain
MSMSTDRQDSCRCLTVRLRVATNRVAARGSRSPALGECFRSIEPDALSLICLRCCCRRRRVFVVCECEKNALNSISSIFENFSARFAFLTNVRVPLKDLSNETSTRGALVTNFVSNVSLSCDEYLQQLEAHRSQYAGYNIVFGDLATGVCYWFTNHVKAPLQRGSDASTLVAAGAPADVASAAPPLAFEARHALVAANTTYVVSNEASLNSQWPKVVKAKRLFDELLTEANKNNIFNIAADDTASSSSSSPAAPMPSNTGSGTGLDELDEQRLFARMFDILLADVERIEDLARLPYTGVPDDFEVYLSSIRVPFLPSLRYGTVSSCVAYVDAHGPLRITERSFRQSPTTPITFRAARHICSNAVGASSWPPMSTAASSSTSSTSTTATTTAAAAMPPFHYSDALKAAAISPSTSRKATKRLIFVGDVHACARELNVLVRLIILRFISSDNIVFLFWRVDMKKS